MSTRRFVSRSSRWIFVAIWMAVLPAWVFSDEERVPILTLVDPSALKAPCGLVPIHVAPDVGEIPLVAVLLPLRLEGDKGSRGTLIEGPLREPTPNERLKLEAARRACPDREATAHSTDDRLLQKEKERVLLEAKSRAQLRIDPAAGLGVEIPEVQETGPPGLNPAERAKLVEQGATQEVRP